LHYVEIYSLFAEVRTSCYLSMRCMPPTRIPILSIYAIGKKKLRRAWETHRRTCKITLWTTLYKVVVWLWIWERLGDRVKYLKYVWYAYIQYLGCGPSELWPCAAARPEPSYLQMRYTDAATQANTQTAQSASSQVKCNILHASIQWERKKTTSHKHTKYVIGIQNRSISMPGQWIMSGIWTKTDRKCTKQWKYCSKGNRAYLNWIATILWLLTPRNRLSCPKLQSGIRFSTLLTTHLAPVLVHR
jgi:hypothetical protein